MAFLSKPLAPIPPEQNGCAERKHRHITETGRTLLHHAKVPLEYWTYAFQTAAYLINRYPNPYPTRRVQMSRPSSPGPTYLFHYLSSLRAHPHSINPPTFFPQPAHHHQAQLLPPPPQPNPPPSQPKH
ncbi:Retrovirus-related Pol polyprotein from transposon RE1, partial [Linum perenne]